MMSFLKGLEKLKSKNIKVIVHIINGLPGEDYNMMMETAKAVANMGVDGIKNSFTSCYKRYSYGKKCLRKVC